MFSVSPEIYNVISRASRWLFAFFALMLLLFALSWLYDERRKRRERFRSLPEAGNIGEMVVISGSDQLPVDTWFPFHGKESSVPSVPVIWSFPVPAFTQGIWPSPGRMEPDW